MSFSSALSIAAAGALLALAACGPRTNAPDAAADEAAIRQLLDGVERAFNSGDLQAGVAVFADDAVISGSGEPDVTGIDTIREMYAGMLQQFAIDADLMTDEIVVAGDLAYERGRYTLKLTDKASGQVVAELRNRHIHIFKRQPDGGWKTWRMMVNNEAAPPGGP